TRSRAHPAHVQEAVDHSREAPVGRLASCAGERFCVRLALVTQWIESRGERHRATKPRQILREERRDARIALPCLVGAHVAIGPPRDVLRGEEETLREARERWVLADAIRRWVDQELERGRGSHIPAEMRADGGEIAACAV